MSEKLHSGENISVSAKDSTQDVRVLAKGAGIAYVGMFSARGIQVLAQIILARLLGPEMFGLYTLGWATLRLLDGFATLGLDKAVIRYGSMYRKKDDSFGLNNIIQRSFIFSIISGGIIGLIIIIGAQAMANLMNEPELTRVLRIFALAFLPLAGLRVLASASRVTQRIQYSIYSEMLGKTVSNLILIIILVYIFNTGVYGASLSTVLANVVGFIIAVYFVIRLFPHILSLSKNVTISTKEMLRFSLPTALASVFLTIILWTNRLFIGYFLSAYEVGIFQAMFQGSYLFLITQTAVNSIFSPMIADLYQAGHINRLNELYKVSTKWVLYLSMPVFLTICFAANEFMTVFFGSEYAESTLPLIVISTGQLIKVGSGAVGFILIMTGHQRRLMIISAIALIGNISLNLYLIPRLGLMGSATATAASSAVIFVAGLISVRNLEQLWPYDKRFIKGLIATTVAVAILGISSLLPEYSSLVTLIVTSILALTAFGGTLLILGLDREDKAFFSMAKERLGRHIPA